jgi:hypothetical protein
MAELGNWEVAELRDRGMTKWQNCEMAECEIGSV